MNLERVLAHKRVVITVGSGGVGKTTLAAAIAVLAARRGLRAIVITIDPARRLANALGLHEFGNQKNRVDPALLGAPDGGLLDAFMLDQKAAFDEVMARYAANAEQRDRIFQNRVYQHMSTTLPGAQEYMAMEKLYELATSGDYDRIVVDTPPTVHALDFLDAPNRVLDLLDNEAVAWLTKRKRVVSGLLDFGTNYIFRTLGRLTGSSSLEALADFLRALEGMYQGLRDRAEKVQQLLASDAVAFVLVSGLGRMQAQEARLFHHFMVERELAFTTLVANRVMVDPLAGGAARPALGQILGGDNLVQRVWSVAEAAHAQAVAERSELDALRKAAEQPTTHVVPRFAQDVHDMDGLGRIGHHLMLGEVLE